MLNNLYRASTRRTAWLILALSALFLELAALYFQYQKDLQPCVLCVYERTAVMGLVLAGVVGSLAPGIALVRGLAMLLWAGSGLWGLQLAMRHTHIQLFPSPTNTCDFAANYPDWAKLDEWIPWLFQPTGFCEEIQWRFLNFTMPQTMIGIYAFYLVVLLAVILAWLFGKSRRSSAGR